MEEIIKHYNFQYYNDEKITFLVPEFLLVGFICKLELIVGCLDFHLSLPRKKEK